ncbi:unnamed protein product, partial [Closterium sp. NIES-54]
MTLRPSTAPQRVPLPSPPTPSLPDGPDPESSSASSALVAELVHFAAACRLDYATSLVAESASVSICPPSVGGECALGTDVLEDKQEDFECIAASVPHLVSMVLAPEGDPDALDIPTPRSYAEAIEGPYSSQWQAAMDAEMASWKSSGTYVDEVPPPGANIISGMWIFRVKRPPGSRPAFRARYVARGFSQRQEVDFFQTFSPTPKMTTLRVLLHVAAQRDYELHSLDFSTAFLQGSLHEEIWLRHPPGFTGSFPTGTQWSLWRPVYGLRQAPREWHDTLRTTLASLGFAPSTSNPSLFLRTDTTLPPFYVLVCVDDLVFATANTEALAHVKSELQKRHTCTDLGELTSYLGLRITRDRAQRTITMTQSHMVQQVLQCFGFTYSSPQSTPLPTSHSLSAPPSDESVEPSGPYPELVGCLMYLMTCTRPDLAYPLSLLSPSRHRKVHWDAAKRVLRYLCCTSGMGLVLGGRAQVVITGHADASWVDDLATQRSSQGYTFSLGSGSVSWRSTRSSSVLSSSCEAEIYAGAMAAQELRWLTYLLTNLGEAPRSPPVLYVDNKAMLALCQEHRLEHRTKHIALRYFLARELQQRGQLRLAYVASQAITADVFTKALQPCDHQRFCTVLGLVVFTVLFVLLYITLHVNWPCGHLLVLRLRGDFVIHPELALPFLTGLVTSCSPPLCLWGFPTYTQLLSSSVIHSFSFKHRVAIPAEFLDRNPPLIYITLYFIVSRLPDSLCAVRDHFLALDPTALIVNLLEQHHLAAETSVVAVGAARGAPRTPFFKGCSPSPLAPCYASAAAVDILGATDVEAASALSGKRRSSKGKGGGSGVSGGGSGGFGGGSGGGGGGGGSGSSGCGGRHGGALREWFAQRGASGDSDSFLYVIRTGDRAGQICEKPHTQHRCFSRLDDAWRAEFGDEAERPCWAKLLRSGVDIFSLDYDAILACASESTLPGTFTLHTGASRCCFRDSTTLTPLSAPVPVRLADPSGGPVLARSSTVLMCPAVPSSSLLGLHLPSFSTNLVSTAALQDAMVTTTTLGGQRVSICTYTRTGRHLATFTRRHGSSLYTLTTEPPQEAASAQVSASGPVAPPYSCRLLSHQTLLRHHRLGHPSLPRLCGSFTTPPRAMSSPLRTSRLT